MTSMIEQENDAGQRGLVWGAAAALILLPLAALKIADPAAWEYGDLPFAFVLLAMLGGGYELAARVRPAWMYRTGVVVALVAGLGQAWVNLAVGIIGSEDNAANLLFFAVIGVALLGAIVARLRPRGMALAMVAAAGAQVSAGLAAFLMGWGFTGPITMLFTGLWGISAWCFHRDSPDPERVIPEPFSRMRL